MKTSSNSELAIALAISAALHAAAILAPLTGLGTGKNKATRHYPAEAVEVRLAPARADSSFPAPALLPLPTPEPASPAATTEGRIAPPAWKYVAVSYWYRTPAELDQPPAIVSPPDFAENLDPRAEGKASLRFFLNEGGTIDWMEIEESTLPEQMLEALKSQYEQLRFTPGEKNGVKVKSVVRYEVELVKAAPVIPSSELTR